MTSFRNARTHLKGNLLRRSFGKILILLQFLLENFLVIGMNRGRVGIELVRVGIDQVDGHSQVVLRQQLVLVGAFQRSGVVLNESRRIERVSDEFRLEGNVGQSVTVFDAA